jgi:GTP-binding protein Era
MTEFIREYFFEKMGLEIPYGMHIEIEEKQETEELMIYNVIIYVKKENHKKIVIGKDAINLKNAISHAILHTQELFPKPLKIKIFVKVDTSWVKNLKQ